jgi:hypothetical protein
MRFFGLAGAAAAMACAACSTSSSSSGSSGDQSSGGSSSSGDTSSSGGSSSSGSSGSVYAPKSWINASLGPSPSPQSNCGLDGSPYVVIGASTNPVQDGASYQNAKATISCSVKTTNGTAYDVTASAALSGVGSVSIAGQFAAGANTTAKIIFTRAGIDPFEDDNCTVSYSAPTHGIAPGRVWARADCPQAVLAAQSRTCPGNIEFRFEGCAQ